MTTGGFEKGTQIIYVPTHAEDAHDPYCEHGFVTSKNAKWIFCRFWHSAPNEKELRTKGNSEPVKREHLVIMDTRDQDLVDKVMIAFGM